MALVKSFYEPFLIIVHIFVPHRRITHRDGEFNHLRALTV